VEVAVEATVEVAALAVGMAMVVDLVAASAKVEDLAEVLEKVAVLVVE
jgi:hypothetical protein